jgi:hypothetical protein
MADDLVLYKEIDTGADDMREAADEIERLRSQVVRISEEHAHENAKIAQAVAAERAAILAMIQALASAEGRSPDHVQMLSGLAAAIQARGEK